MDGATPLIILVHPLPPLLRGPAQSLATFARYLEQRYDLVIAAPEGPFLRHARTIASRSTLFTLPLYQNRQISWAHGSAALLSAFEHVRRPVLIHANMHAGLNLAAPLAIRLRSPVFVHFHAPALLRRSRIFLQTWKRLGVRMNFYPVSNFSWGLLETTSVGELVRGLLPNPIEYSTFETTRRGDHWPFRIGFVGEGLPVKGFHRLVEVAALLKHEDVEWHVYGIDRTNAPTPYLSQCLAQIRMSQLEDRIILHGTVDDVATAYRSMDALFVPSGSESFGRVAVEGMASGLPVVATRVAGLSEVIWDGSSGLLFDPEHPWEAAKHLRSLIGDPELRAALCTGALQAARRFDINTVGPALEAYYEDLLNPGSRDAKPIAAAHHGETPDTLPSMQRAQ